jgi:hypothetical protein
MARPSIIAPRRRAKSSELPSLLPRPDDLRDRVPPSPVQGLAVLRHVGVPGSSGPQIEPEEPFVEDVLAGLLAEGTGELDESYELLRGSLEFGQLARGLLVELSVGERERFAEEPVLGLEVVDDQG